MGFNSVFKELKSSVMSGKYILIFFKLPTEVSHLDNACDLIRILSALCSPSV